MKRMLITVISIAISAGSLCAQTMSDMLGSLGGKTKVEERYTFDHTARMELKVTQKGGKKTSLSEMDLASAADEATFCMEVISMDGKPQKEQAIMLFDAPNKTMVTLTTDGKGERMGVAMAFDPAEIEKQVDAIEKASGENITPENMRFSKTGNTREILGYDCSEYTFDSDKTEGVMWITEDADLNIATFFGAMGQGKGKKEGLFSDVPGYPEGMIMDMRSTEKKSGNTSEMRITAIDMNASKTITPTDWNIMSFSDMMGN